MQKFQHVILIQWGILCVTGALVDIKANSVRIVLMVTIATQEFPEDNVFPSTVSFALLIKFMSFNVVLKQYS